MLEERINVSMFRCRRIQVAIIVFHDICIVIGGAIILHSVLYPIDITIQNYDSIRLINTICGKFKPFLSVFVHGCLVQTIRTRVVASSPYTLGHAHASKSYYRHDK